MRDRWLVRNDAQGADCTLQIAYSTEEAKRLILEFLDWYLFFCRSEESTAPNFGEEQKWREKIARCQKEIEAINSIPHEDFYSGGFATVEDFHITVQHMRF